MKLLIDAGNTRIKWALVNEGGDWQRNGIMPVGQANELPGLFADSQNIRQIWASNVAGEEVAHHIRAIVNGRTARLHFVVAQEAQCGVRNGYADAVRLGSDRWAALVAVWRLVQGKCLVVNCGTAITIDALSGEGKFLGGLIMPGVELMQHSLDAATAQLKSGHAGQGIYAPFPLNTADAMFSGAIQAACGAIQRQHGLLGDQAAPVVLSGGAAELLRGHLPQCGQYLPLQVVDNLVLQGVLLISLESDKQ